VITVSGIADDVDDDLGAIWRQLEDDLRPTRREHAGQVLAAAADAGLVLEAESVATTTSTASPNDAAAALEDRLYAPLWDVDPDTWSRVVAPRIMATRALPEPDRQRERHVCHPLWVWQRAGN
jgi:hypothetical protein